MLEIIKANAEESLWVADKPLSLGGKPRKILIGDVNTQFNFTYSENIFCSSPLNEITFDHDFDRDVLRTRLDARLQNPLTNKLVICFINDSVGYGLFAREFIPAGTIIGLYAGELINNSIGDDYGVAVSDTKLTITAKNTGGITRFIQHMPFSFDAIANAIKTSNKKTFVRIMDGNGIFFDDEDISFLTDKRTLDNAKMEHIKTLNELTRNSKLQEEMQNDPSLGNKKSLAVANVVMYPITYKNKHVVYFQTCLDINEGEQLGASYGMAYWRRKKLNPSYFDIKGRVLLTAQQKKENLFLASSTFFQNQSPGSWKEYPGNMLTGKYTGHQVMYLTLQSSSSEGKSKASLFCRNLTNEGYSVELKESQGKPSLVVDLSDSSPALK